MRKKIVALLMALTMVPALAACGSSNGTGNNTAGAPAESQTGETTAARENEVGSQGETKAETNAESKAEAPALSGTMKVVATSENYVTLFDKFTEDTGVKVELLSMSSGEVLSKLVRRAAHHLPIYGLEAALTHS